MKLRRVILLAALLAVIAGTGCQRKGGMADGATDSSQTAATVIAQNSNHLMALPDVVGIYEGLLPDGKTHCITVMLAKTNSTTVKQLPDSLGGYPVQVEVTGEIRPLSK